MKRGCAFAQPLEIIGGQRGNRTPDTGIFNPLLYQLSYLARNVGSGALWTPVAASAALCR